MALILSLETSAARCSVALHQNGTLINTLTITENQAHAAKLAILIKEIVADRMPHLSAIAVSAGPGSYTGLRIGTSTAKGICFALNIPLIAINTLDILSFQFVRKNLPSDGLLCPMIDAKRMEVYCQVVNKNLETIIPAEAKIVDENSFAELLNGQPMFFFGDGALKCRSVISHINAHFTDHFYPEADTLAQMAWIKYQQKAFDHLVNFVPFYLKDFVAKKTSPAFRP